MPAMKLILSHNTAALYWLKSQKHPDEFPLLQPDAAFNSGFITTAKDIDDLLQETPLDAGMPIHMLVPGNRLRHRSERLEFHTYRGTMPRSALRKVAEHLYVTSPEFCFMQMAAVMGFEEQVKFGMRLCARYSEAVKGREVKPLTSTAQIDAFLSAMKGHDGIKQSRRALNYLLDQSGSPRETAESMLAFLPRASGGYARPFGKMNMVIPLNKELSRITGKNHLECDLCWPKEKVAVEYDSDEYHSTSDENLADSIKRSALKQLGFKVITIRKRQLDVPILFDSVMRELTLDLGLRIREPFAPGWEKIESLRHLVFSKVDFPSLA